jgi:hypothetical protein
MNISRKTRRRKIGAQNLAVFFFEMESMSFRISKKCYGTKLETISVLAQ